uniref:Metalloendopeptidase n=1 Tax=Romanomermis culicivorax TaxID=13658 RepID=A0A915K2J4_ROMCU
MHYGPRAFSRNGRSTIVPLKPNVRIGQRKGFSDLDLRKLALLYGCGSGSSIIGEKSSEVVDHVSTPVDPKRNETCVDLKSECRMLKIMGFCKSFRHWMTVNCRSTCRFCRKRADSESGENPASPGKGEIDCTDHNGSVCAFWEYAGLCDEFRDFASKHCRKSCKMCQS